MDTRSWAAVTGRSGLLALLVGSATLLVGCWTVHETDEDASQGRGGVDVTIMDVLDAARGPQRLGR